MSTVRSQGVTRSSLAARELPGVCTAWQGGALGSLFFRIAVLSEDLRLEGADQLVRVRGDRHRRVHWQVVEARAQLQQLHQVLLGIVYSDLVWTVVPDDGVLCHERAAIDRRAGLHDDAEAVLLLGKWLVVRVER